MEDCPPQLTVPVAAKHPRAAYSSRVTERPPPLPNALHHAFHSELDASQRAGLLSWLSFTGTFAGVRGITWSIRAGKGPFGNLSMGGEHLHHYMWGIAMLAGVGAVAVRGEDEDRRHPAVSTAYGAGLALIVDEFALLLDLKDVCWAKQGRMSVDLGVGGIAAAGSYFAALPVLRKVRKDRKDHQNRRRRALQDAPSAD
jgi:hypothetical protein